MVNPARGTLSINSYIGQGGFWTPVQVDLNFPPQKIIQNWAIGHLDSDAYPDLVLLVAQPEGGSIFEEMELMIYRGEGPGKWGRLPMQSIKTQQNIWQAGPIEISKRGIRLFYYKGLIRSLFRIDFYPMMESEVVQPEPDSHGWKMKGADRDTIVIHQDLNGDGLNDLLLSGEDGLMCYPAQSGFRFREASGYRFGKREGHHSTEFTLGSGGFNISIQEVQRVKGNGKFTLVFCKDGIQIWSLDRDLTGQWVLARKDVNRG